MAQSHAPVNEVPFPAYEAKNPAVDSYLYVHASDLREAVQEFMTGKGAKHPRPVTPTTAPQASPTAQPSRKHNKPASIPGLEQAKTEGENMAVLAEAQGHLGFPFYFPGLRKTGSRYADTKPRIYTVRDVKGKPYKAYRLVLNAGSYGEYYGIQGLAWRDPPILDDPDRVQKFGKRKLGLYYDGSHLRLVAWKTAKAAYWVTNTLTLSIPNNRLIAIAGSLRRLKS
jgi:polyisoprenyl-teichoic acid--peptidoglycan teichoic acid transferase